ncbi:MAG TPA: protein kinase [Candidatus Solibacter sp.]|nr:protein kinase [Candidatus Solibacter sp.]
MASGGPTPTNLVRFGGQFELDLHAYELRHSGQPLKLEHIPMELLLLLIAQRGQLVSRDQIVEKVWGKDVFLDTDNSINAAIRKIRQVLKDDPEQPRFVQTLTGRGYRFIAAVEEIGPPPTSAIGPDRPAPVPETLLGKKVSHYRIVKVLGGGGMGVVYQAEDLKLGRRVALKFLPSELSNDPKALGRMQREARAASALDHPNICAVYELGDHEGQPFIAMQLLEGQTLREWIASGRDISSPGLAQVVGFAVQIADGLDAAHGKGIIHRDIKPANIFITSRNEVKILDFGVAKFLDDNEIGESGNPKALAEPTDAHLTQTGASIGTPSYLSPEQIRREKLDSRTDLFSFGLVLYEMATGKQAFSGDTVRVIRDAVLNSPPMPPRQACANIPIGLEKIIGKSLEKDRNLRYQSAQEMRADLLGLGAGAVRPQAKPRSIRTWVAVGVFVLLLAVVAFNAGGIRRKFFERSSPEKSTAGFKTRPSIAVLGFRNLSGRQDQAWISTALSEMLSSDLSAGQQLRVIPSEDVSRMKIDLQLAPADNYGRDTLRQIRNYAGSDIVVLGSYLAMGRDADGKVRIDLQLQDARAGETIGVVQSDGTEAGLAELVSQGGAALRQKLGVANVSQDDVHHVARAVPANPEAARLYAEGLTSLQTFDALGARDLLQKAIAIDPNHAQSHSALARCWSILGYDAKAREEAKKAVDLSSNLLREDQLSIEGHYRETTHEWQKAVEIYRMLWGVFPDNLDYGLELARAQASGGSGKDALATVETLAKLPPPAGTDPRIDLVEVLAADQIGDLHREEAAAARAEEKGRRQGAKIITASALLNRGSALIGLGDNKNAIPALQEAQAFFSAVGDQQSAARALINLGIVEIHQSNLDEAQKHLESALDISRKTGNTLGIIKAENSLGNVFYLKGDLAHSVGAFQDNVQRSREIGAKRSESTAVNNLANMLVQEGKLKEAEKTYDDAQRLNREMGDEEGVGVALTDIADLLTREGRLQAAKKASEDAIAIHRKVGDKSFEAYARHQLGLVLSWQGDVAGGRSQYQQALALRHELGEKFTEAETQLQLAQLQLNTGDAAGAETGARNTSAVYHAQGAFDDEALSYDLLSQALVAQKKIPEALQAIAKSKELLAKSIDQLTHLQVAIDDGYVAGMSQSRQASNDAKTLDGAKILEAVREKADQMGYASLAMEARLRLGEVEIENGRTKAGRAHLEQLQKDAQAKGFVLIARQAGVAMKLQSARR